MRVRFGAVNTAVDVSDRRTIPRCRKPNLMARSEFHDDAHPEATKLTGNRKYGPWGQCVAHSKSADRRCRQPAKGAHGKCSTHGGETENDTNDKRGRGDQEDNTNAVTHGAWTDQKKLYSEEFAERERDLTDWVYDDYHGRYVDRHGTEPPGGFQLRLFNIAVNVVTEMRVENWYTDKPAELDTATPHMDRETHVSESGREYYRYKKSPALAAMKHLSDYNHKWLKAMDLLPEADSGGSGTVEGIITVISSEVNDGG